MIIAIGPHFSNPDDNFEFAPEKKVVFFLSREYLNDRFISPIFYRFLYKLPVKGAVARGEKIIKSLDDGKSLSENAICSFFAPRSQIAAT